MSPLNAEELETCLELMQRLVDTYRYQPNNERLNSLVRKLNREGKKRLRDQEVALKDQVRRKDRALLANTQLVQHQRD